MSETLKTFTSCLKFDLLNNKPEILSAFKREPRAWILKSYNAMQCNTNAIQCNAMVRTSMQYYIQIYATQWNAMLSYIMLSNTIQCYAIYNLKQTSKQKKCWKVNQK